MHQKLHVLGCSTTHCVPKRTWAAESQRAVWTSTNAWRSHTMTYFVSQLFSCTSHSVKPLHAGPGLCGEGHQACNQEGGEGGSTAGFDS